MLFNSAEFLFAFLPLALIGYFLLGRLDGLASRGWLCLCSLVFYAWWNPAFLVVLVCSILFNFGTSLLIGGASGRARTGWLAVGVTGNLATLAYYKYAMWLSGVLFGAGLPVSPLSGIALPLGISFFTFTQIGYLIDVKEAVAKERGFVNYVLFVTFFPHLIAGPILHHREVMPQFADQTIDRFDRGHFAIGVTVFLVGLFKKTVIADGLQPIVATGYGQSAIIGVGGAWLTMTAYAAQLYFDFSGYSDMAIGIARMFNVKFPINFNSPYKANNIADYWSRWHMTLTRYLNAYLYNPVAVPLTRYIMAGAAPKANPLATPRGFLLTVAVPTFWTMTLAGIWHGAGAQFVIFGLLHSSYIAIHRGWSAFGPKRPKRNKNAPLTTSERARYAIGVLLTLASACVANLFFRAPDLPTALAMLDGAFGGRGAGHAVMASPGAMYETVGQEIAALVAAFVVIWGLPNIYEMLGDASPAIGKTAKVTRGLFVWRPNLRWALAIAAMGVLGVLFIGRTTEFIYFQF